MIEEVLTLNQLAREVGISERSGRRLVRKGTLRADLRSGRMLLFIAARVGAIKAQLK